MLIYAPVHESIPIQITTLPLNPEVAYFNQAVKLPALSSTTEAIAMIRRGINGT
jgi:hypothetical protein